MREAKSHGKTAAEWEAWLRPFVLRYPERFHDDLMQEARLGLFTARRRYKPGEAAFTTYATHFVEGNLRHFMRDRVQTIRVASRAYYVGLRIVCVSNERAASPGEQGEPLDYYANRDVWEETVVYAPGFEEVALSAMHLRDALATLRPKHRAVVWLRAVEQRTFYDIGETLGISYQCARNYYRAAARCLIARWERKNELHL